MKSIVSFQQHECGGNEFRSMIPSSRNALVCAVFLLSIFLLAAPSTAQEKAPAAPNMGEVSAKLSNPVSDVWALFTEFDVPFSTGDLNTGSAKVGGRMIFQPVLPIPLYGGGKQEWKLITRPIVPVLFSQAVPKSFDEFNSLGGLGDIQLPMMVSPPSGNWLLGVGPTWLFPSSTQDKLGQQQWGAGPATVIGYHTKKWTAGIFPQYTWGIGGSNSADKPDASYLNALYFFHYNLPDAWQFGFDPTASFDNNATSGEKWNVPVGLFVSKTTRIRSRAVKFRLGIEYSIVKEDAFGQAAQFKFNIIPVIPSLIRNSLFGK